MMNAEILKAAEQRRLAWRCRRGLLELDIVLQRFVSRYFNGLTLAEMAHFDAMLELPDQQFWTLIQADVTEQPVRKPSLAQPSVRLPDADEQSLLAKLRASRTLSCPPTAEALEH